MLNYSPTYYNLTSNSVAVHQTCAFFLLLPVVSGFSFCFSMHWNTLLYNTTAGGVDIVALWIAGTSIRHNALCDWCKHDLSLSDGRSTPDRTSHGGWGSGVHGGSSCLAFCPAGTCPPCEAVTEHQHVRMTQPKANMASMVNNLLLDFVLWKVFHFW